MLDLDFSVFPQLETKRLILRRLSIDDVDEVFFLRSDLEVLRLIGKEPIKDISEAKSFIKRVADESKEAFTILWGIALKQNIEKIIGTICFWNINKENHRAEIGYALQPIHWRKGYMKESVLEVLKFGFGSMGLHSVEARTSVENTPSIAILKSTGFKKEGHLKEDIYSQGKFKDSLIFSRLA